MFIKGMMLINIPWMVCYPLWELVTIFLDRLRNPWNRGLTTMLWRVALIMFSWFWCAFIQNEDVLLSIPFSKISPKYSLLWRGWNQQAGMFPFPHRTMILISWTHGGDDRMTTDDRPMPSDVKHGTHQMINASMLKAQTLISHWTWRFPNGCTPKSSKLETRGDLGRHHFKKPTYQAMCFCLHVFFWTDTNNKHCCGHMGMSKTNWTPTAAHAGDEQP